MRLPRILISAALYIILFSAVSPVSAQMITGTWHGRIGRQKVEVKIIKTGDSLTGTSYYYDSPNNFRRWSIRGYFDPETNSAVWWDDQLLEEKSGRLSISSPGKIPQLASADFNCPGSGRMLLDGKSGKKNQSPDGEVHLIKNGEPVFPDEWDYVIDNYTVGGNDPDLIDSIRQIAFQRPDPVVPVTTPVVKPVSTITEKPVETIPETPSEPEPVLQKPVDPVVLKKPVIPVSKPVVTVQAPPVPEKKEVPIEEKYRLREKQFTKEIPVTGDTLELRFYDNAEVDGDSISLFLNGKLIFEHIRLTASAYTIKLAVSDLQPDNELTMVAENLGSIPPNTSYMIAQMGEARFDAYLASTEGSSAMIRLRKQTP